PGCTISLSPLRTHNFSPGMCESVSHFLAAKIGVDEIRKDIFAPCGLEQGANHHTPAPITEGGQAEMRPNLRDMPASEPALLILVEEHVRLQYTHGGSQVLDETRW